MIGKLAFGPNRFITRSSTIAVALWLAACAQVSQVATGEVTVKDRMTVSVDKPWNQFERGMGDAVPTWTQDGITVDALRFYVGLKDGDLLAPTPSTPKGQAALAFKSTMKTSDIVGLFEGLYSRGGSSFTLVKVAPHAFAGTPGFRIDFTSLRKEDDVQLQGVLWGTVRNGELHALSYTAPRLAFFKRHSASAESIASSVRVR